MVTGKEHRRMELERRQAAADERLRVDDPDRDSLALALHEIDCGWNCQGHGILQPVKDAQYGRMADAALRFLARQGRLTVIPAETDKAGPND